ncbi:MAG: carbohydrate kinase [Erysipelotrichaceae bacterium]
MKKCCAIGEALIDFIPNEKGKRLKDVTSFRQVVGGAPTNVAATVAKLGGESFVLTKLGQDAFGDNIISTLDQCGIDTQYIIRSEMLDTSLAFVALSEDGNRDFKFYRKTAADLDYSKDDIPFDAIDECGIIHFCSVSLVESKMKQAHLALIEDAIKKGVLVSFDPNLRLSLWDDHDALRKTVLDFIPYADILKLSDEEVEFITGHKKIEEALPQLFQDRCKMVLYTEGKDGATLYTKSGHKLHTQGICVDVVDTTGAGDSFIGAFLYRMLSFESCLNDIDEKQMMQHLEFANMYAAHTTTKEGALNALAAMDELETFIKDIKKED